MTEVQCGGRFGDALDRLGRWVAQPGGSFPSTATALATNAFIDTVACMIAGAQEPAPVRAARALSAWSGRGSTLVTGGRDSPPNAALINATAGHALDFDDFDAPSVSHPSVCLVPAILALGEEISASGRACVEAYVIGLEVMDRFGLLINPVHYDVGWHATPTLGSLGAAAACARLLELSADQSLHAIAMSTSMAGGLKAQFGSDTKPLHAGFAARNGVLAARLAAEGLTASGKALLGRESFTALFAASSESQVTKTIDRMGDPTALEEYGLFVKRYPCCGYLARPLDGVLTLRRDHDLTPDDIGHVTLNMPPRNGGILGFRFPRTPNEARFSATYCTAVALCDGDVTLGAFSPEAIANPRYTSLIDRIDLVLRDSSVSEEDLSPDDPDHVTIDLKDGRSHSTTVRVAEGSPSKPLDRAALFAKLDACAQGRIDDARLAALGQRLDALPDLETVAEIPNLMSGDPRNDLMNNSGA